MMGRVLMGSLVLALPLLLMACNPTSAPMNESEQKVPGEFQGAGGMEELDNQPESVQEGVDRATDNPGGSATFTPPAENEGEGSYTPPASSGEGNTSGAH